MALVTLQAAPATGISAAARETHHAPFVQRLWVKHVAPPRLGTAGHNATAVLARRITAASPLILPSNTTRVRRGTKSRQQRHLAIVSPGAPKIDGTLARLALETHPGSLVARPSPPPAALAADVRADELVTNSSVVVSLAAPAAVRPAAMRPAAAPAPPPAARLPAAQLLAILTDVREGFREGVAWMRPTVAVGAAALFQLEVRRAGVNGAETLVGVVILCFIVFGMIGLFALFNQSWSQQAAEQDSKQFFGPPDTDQRFGSLGATPADSMRSLGVQPGPPIFGGAPNSNPFDTTGSGPSLPQSASQAGRMRRPVCC